MVGDDDVTIFDVYFATKPFFLRSSRNLLISGCDVIASRFRSTYRRSNWRICHNSMWSSGNQTFWTLGLFIGSFFLFLSLKLIGRDLVLKPDLDDGVYVSPSNRQQLYLAFLSNQTVHKLLGISESWSAIATTILRTKYSWRKPLRPTSRRLSNSVVTIDSSVVTTWIESLKKFEDFAWSWWKMKKIYSEFGFVAISSHLILCQSNLKR